MANRKPLRQTIESWLADLHKERNELVEDIDLEISQLEDILDKLIKAEKAKNTSQFPPPNLTATQPSLLKDSESSHWDTKTQDVIDDVIIEHGRPMRAKEIIAACIASGRVSSETGDEGMKSLIRSAITRGHKGGRFIHDPVHQMWDSKKRLAAVHQVSGKVS